MQAVHLVLTLKPFRNIRTKDKRREKKKKNTGQAVAVDKPFWQPQAVRHLKEGHATTSWMCGLQAPRGFLLKNLLKKLVLSASLA